jgi:hypothetical protein
VKEHKEIFYTLLKCKSLRAIAFLSFHNSYSSIVIFPDEQFIIDNGVENTSKIKKNKINDK